MADLVGRLDKRVRLWGIGSERDPSNGSVTDTRSFIGAVWAQYRQLSGRDVEIASARQSAEECKFRLRFRQLPARVAIESEGVFYLAVRVEPIGRRQWLDVYARREG